MDSLDLLAREDEFKKLNKQLEKKTESLMKEIEHVMQKQDIFSEFSSSLSLNFNHSTTNIKKHCCDKPESPQSTEIKPNCKNRTQSLSKNSNNSNLELKKDLNLDNDANKGFNSKEINTGNENNSKNCANRIVCICCTDVRSNKNQDLDFLYAFVSVNVKDKVLPQSFSKDNITVENVCKFLSSKVKLMQDQIDKLQNTINKKASQCEAHLTQLAELESERMTLLNKTNNMKTSTVEMRAKYMALQKRLDEKERLYKEQRSETDKLTSEVKRLRSRNAGVEARHASQEQAIEELKQQLQVATRSEKELRDASRSLSESHQNVISRLESQLKALNSRIDKQNALIDNLRKQNVLMATDGALKALEREYCKFLTEA